MRLRPQLGALGRDEALLDEGKPRRRHRPVRLRPVGGAPARHLIHHVDRKATAQEKLRPALAPVRRSGEVGAGLAAAVDHHDGIGMLQLLRDLKLDIHLPDHGRTFDRRIDLAAGEEVALPGDDQRTVGRGLRRERRDAADDAHGRQDGEHQIVSAEHAYPPVRDCFGWRKASRKWAGCHAARSTTNTAPSCPAQAGHPVRRVVAGLGAYQDRR